MQKDYHNVLIFGAGVSATAGIPLLGNFVDTMWSYSSRKKVGNTQLSDLDLKYLQDADAIRKGLEPYNSRAYFDNRNIEDVLSLLSFEAMLGEKGVKEYDTMVEAIARTIELSCQIPFDNGSNQPPNHQQLYLPFWNALFNNNQLKGNYPALITFNYDLVLERSLWEYFHWRGTPNGQGLPVRSCHLKYFSEREDVHVKKNITIGPPAQFVYADDTLEPAEVEIPYLKLHGSLNWTRQKLQGRSPNPPTQVVDKPLILPPVFNKMKTGDVDKVWGEALRLLRNAKHIVIVGYSLPRTDIYMQYFLKSAVGPNSDLQKIIVFNPSLFAGRSAAVTPEAKEMRSRYEDCFSPQFVSRIAFNPTPHWESSNGTLKHFETMLMQGSREILFYP